MNLSIHEDRGWFTKLGLSVRPEPPSQSQKAALEDADWFFSPVAQDWFKNNNLAYRRGVIFSGSSYSGKTWVTEQIAMTHKKQIMLFNANEDSMGRLKSALHALFMNCIVVVEYLDELYSRISSHDRGNILKDLASAFNYTFDDRKGTLLVFTLPSSPNAELLRFLQMPHRCQRKFELSLSDGLLLEQLVRSAIESRWSIDPLIIRSLVNRCVADGMPVPALKWMLAGNSYASFDKLKEAVEHLGSAMKAERFVLDAAARGGADRLYT